MVAISIYAGAIIGYLAHVYQMDGYSLTPYWKDGKLQLNAILSLIVAVAAFLITVNSGLPGATSFYAAVLAGFGAPFAIDTIVTKSSIGNTEEIANAVEGQDGA